jgi:hypothetical protein
MQKRTNKINCYILVGKSEGKRALGKPTHEMDDNIEVPFKEKVCEQVNRIHLDRATV